MGLFKEELQGMLYFYYGFCGWTVVLTVYFGIYYGCKRLVKWIGNKITTYKKAKQAQI